MANGAQCPTISWTFPHSFLATFFVHSWKRTLCPVSDATVCARAVSTAHVLAPPGRTRPRWKINTVKLLTAVEIDIQLQRTATVSVETLKGPNDDAACHKLTMARIGGSSTNCIGQKEEPTVAGSSAEQGLFYQW